ncbi:MAG TPA: hypothetical protein VK887_04890 [Pseudonocardiaceae bacterium]|nr:hypothetical protein [Pseudonocardiaceae bacterium]
MPKVYLCVDVHQQLAVCFRATVASDGYVRRCGDEISAAVWSELEQIDWLILHPAMR